MSLERACSASLPTSYVLGLKHWRTQQGWTTKQLQRLLFPPRLSTVANRLTPLAAAPLDPCQAPGARCRQWLDHPWGRLSGLTAHVFSGRPICNRGWGWAKTARRCASQLARSASRSWNGAGFVPNSTGDHQRQKVQASRPGRSHSPGKKCELTAVSSAPLYYQH